VEHKGLYIVLAIVSGSFSICPLILSLIRFPYLKGYLVPVFFLVFVSVLMEGMNILLVRSLINNFFLLHFYTVFEFIMINCFYVLFFRQFFNSLLLWLPAVIFLIIAFLDYKANGLDHFDNFSTGVESILCSFFALAGFYFIMRKMVFANILNEPFFWINSGILLYFGGNLVLFVFNSYIIKNAPDTHFNLWIIHSILNILNYTLISIGFWKAKKA